MATAVDPRDTLLDESELADRTSLIDRYGRPFATGEVLFREGDAAREAFVVQEGRIRILKRIRMADKSLALLRAGDLFGEGALLENDPIRRSTAIAVSDGIALSFDKNALRSLLQKDPLLASRLLSQLVRRLRDAEDQIELLLLKDTQSKIIGCLLKLAGLHQDSAELSISPVELSTRVGLDVATVKRAIQKLREQQYVRIVGERVEIPDVEALRRLYALLGSKEELAR